MMTQEVRVRSERKIVFESARDSPHRTAPLKIRPLVLQIWAAFLRLQIGARCSVGSMTRRIRAERLRATLDRAKAASGQSLHILRRRDEFLHLGRRTVLAHLPEPDAMDPRVLILILDLVAALLDALRHCRLVLAAS